MKLSLRSALLPGSGAFLAATFSLQAQTTVLVNESFTGGIPSGWSTASSTQSSVSAGSSPASALDGDAARHLGTSSAATNGLHYTRFDAVTLASAGDSLTFTFDFRGVSYAQNTNNYFDFGILSSAAIPQGDPFALASTFGYAMAARMDSRTDQTNNPTTFRSLSGGALGTPAQYGAGTATGDRFYFHNDNLADRMQLSFSITRLANSDLRLTANFENVSQSVSFSVSYDVAAASLLNGGSADPDAPYTFDMVALGFQRAGSAQSVFDFDNVHVSFSSIPEPGSFAAAAGLGALALAGLRRRRPTR